MAGETKPAFLRRLLTNIGFLAVLRTRPRIPSRVLDRALRMRVQERASKVTLEIPHFWALYVHEGRGDFGVRRPGVKMLAWFKNPEQDPRLQPEPPVRASQIKRLRLEPAQFKALLASGQLVLARRRQGDAPRPFFIEALEDGTFPSDAEQIIDRDFRAYVDSQVKKVTDSVSVKLR